MRCANADGCAITHPLGVPTQTKQAIPLRSHATATRHRRQNTPSARPQAQQPQSRQPQKQQQQKHRWVGSDPTHLCFTTTRPQRLAQQRKSTHAFGRLPWLAALPARARRLRPRLLIVMLLHRLEVLPHQESTCQLAKRKSQRNNKQRPIITARAPETPLSGAKVSNVTLRSTPRQQRPPGLCIERERYPAHYPLAAEPPRIP